MASRKLTAKAPAFQFYPTDFLSDPKVMVMTAEEVGAYWLLICACWLDGELPNDARYLAKLAKLSDEQFARVWPAVERCFRATDTGYTHGRLERERAKQREYRKAKSVSGLRGAKSRWQKDGTAMRSPSTKNGTPIVLPMAKDGSSSLSSSSSSTSVIKNIPPKEPADPRVKTFIEWFQSEYQSRRNGAEYLVPWPRDTALVKKMLKVVDLGQLQDCARILLSEKTDDKFIQDSDRSIGVLSIKFNWLNDKRAAWVARHRGTGAA